MFTSRSLSEIIFVLGLEVGTIRLGFCVCLGRVVVTLAGARLVVDAAVVVGVVDVV